MGIDDVITYKNHHKGIRHFGKTTGVDLLNGKPLLVIGTPHYPPFLYKLIAYTLGLKGIDFNANMNYQHVQHNGDKFDFMTFNAANMALRNIQFWMIESELEQAVGRARLTLNENEVHLFSNFPLLQAILRKFDYEKLLAE